MTKVSEESYTRFYFGLVVSSPLKYFVTLYKVLLTHQLSGNSYYRMECVADHGFPKELTGNVQNLDAALSEIEKVINQLTSVPLHEAHSKVEIIFFQKNIFV